jgi:glycosyltransferase involved in cell wall biosynthesis
VILATFPHYADHLAPVAALLPPDLDVALVAGHTDVLHARGSRTVLMQHGAGQSYGTDHRNYPGGKGNDSVGLFLTPNAHSADRWRRAYPRTPVAAVGCPKLETLPDKEPGPPTVALSFHFDLPLYPETRSALPWYLPALRELAQRFTVIGTGHPRRRDLARVYGKVGIEYVPDFREVCRRADVLAFDNTSVGFEFAATGRPVVVMDAPWYRREIGHGLRFWEASSVGVRVAVPEALAPAIERALELRDDDVRRREEALDIVYAYRTGAARRAADTIMEWAA